MAHESKLEVYKIYLQPTPTTNNASFSDALKKKFPSNPFVPREGLKQFLQDLISSIDTDFVLNEANKKGLRIDETANPIERSIKLNSTKQIISGTIKGGRYGQNRSIGSTKNPRKKYTKVAETDIVMDTFYFLLYTPFGSDKGILMIQSYSDDQINDVFINWLRKNLKTPGYYNPNFETYCPSKLQEEFKSTSAVKELKFTKDILVSDIESSEGITTEEFTISISIRAKEEGEKLTTLKNLVNQVKKLTFGNKRKPLTLEDFNRQTGVLYNGSHQSSFELGGDIDIKPTIYLKDRVELQPDESPKWESLNKFCLELLEDIKKEVYPENDELS